MPLAASPLIVVACASFKGTLSSRQAGVAIARGLGAAGITAPVVALADGGEGLVEAIAGQVPGAQWVQTPCRGPLGQTVQARFAMLPATTSLQPQLAPLDSHASAKTAVLEMAASSGLGLVNESERDPKHTTTWGVGDQILAALERGATRIILGIGGSATNDGGAGMAQALGAKLLDSSGAPVPPGGAALAKLARIDVSGLDQRLRRVSITVACDVRNPLCGPHGASAVFGPQKGASGEDVQVLDAALAHYAEVLRNELGKDVRDIPGAGAAGGLGAGGLAFLNATLRSGIELVLDTVGFEQRLSAASAVVTGEGRLDRQTLMGKAPAGVAARAAHAGKPCIAIGGTVDESAAAELRTVFFRTESLAEYAGSLDAAKKDAAAWLERLARARAGEWGAAVPREGP